MTWWRHNVTSDDLLSGKWRNNAPGMSSIAYLVMILGELSKFNAHWVTSFLPLTDNGNVTKLTIRDISATKCQFRGGIDYLNKKNPIADIKNPRNTNRIYLCPYCKLRVSNSLDLWCAFGRVSNFEERNFRSGHLMSPGGVIFAVRRSTFSGNVSTCSINWYAKIGGATHRRFLRYPQKKLS